MRRPATRALALMLVAALVLQGCTLIPFPFSAIGLAMSFSLNMFMEYALLTGVAVLAYVCVFPYVVELFGRITVGVEYDQTETEIEANADGANLKKLQVLWLVLDDQDEEIYRKKLLIKCNTTTRICKNRKFTINEVFPANATHEFYLKAVRGEAPIGTVLGFHFIYEALDGSQQKTLAKSKTTPAGRLEFVGH